MRSEVIEFQGIKFRRYPDSPRWADRSYFTPGQVDRRAGVGRLHEEIWIAAHGPIPEGHDVHHADFDPTNNDLTNLVCLTEAEHKEAHRQRSVEWGRAHPPTPQALAAAAEWHRSEEGRAVHAEMGRRRWEGRTPEPRVCEQCGAAYETRAIHGRERFCSDRCRAAARRASGVDDVERHCACCGSAFTVNRYQSNRFCTRSCAVRHTARRSCGHYQETP